MKESRIVWVDNVKIIAMVLVVLGHFYQSMTLSGIVGESGFYEFFNTFIYLFHVQLFFMCSGWLYQKYSKVTTFSEWKNNVVKKFIAFAIPYFTFSIISYLFKTLFASSVNTKADSLVHSLFVEPAAPFWFLYTLFFIFLITPTAKSKKSAAIILLSGIVFYIITATVKQQIRLPYAIAITAIYLIRFSTGIFLCKFDFKKIFSPYSILMFISAAVITAVSMKYELPGFLTSIVASFLACFGIIGFVGWIYRNNKQSPIFGFLSKYTMSVFLMHTIFAAGIRAVLFKVGISTPAVHIVLGLAATFAGPIIAQIIMEKTHLDFFIYPLKYIKLKKSKVTQSN